MSYIKRKVYPSLIEEKKVNFNLENFNKKLKSQKKVTWHTPDKIFIKHTIFEMKVKNKKKTSVFEHFYPFIDPKWIDLHETHSIWARWNDF